MTAGQEDGAQRGTADAGPLSDRALEGLSLDDMRRAYQALRKQHDDLTAENGGLRAELVRHVHDRTTGLLTPKFISPFQTDIIVDLLKHPLAGDLWCGRCTYAEAAHLIGEEDIWRVAIDVADLKGANSAGGYSLGDTYLATVAQVILNRCAMLPPCGDYGTGTAGNPPAFRRFSGDELVAFFVGMDRQQARELVEGIITDVQAAELSGLRTPPDVSVGVFSLFEGVYIAGEMYRAFSDIADLSEPKGKVTFIRTVVEKMADALCAREHFIGRAALLTRWRNREYFLEDVFGGELGRLRDALQGITTQNIRDMIQEAGDLLDQGNVDRAHQVFLRYYVLAAAARAKDYWHKHRHVVQARAETPKVDWRFNFYAICVVAGLDPYKLGLLGENEVSTVGENDFSDFSDLSVA